jgi:GNAT superfamily N-acetyltransferase
MTHPKPILAIRRPHLSEHSLVRSVVQTVVDETYSGQWAPAPLQIDEEDWSLAWLGVVDEEVGGMVLTHRDWVSDLWVLKEFRCLGVGTMLLTRSETEIAERGYSSARLRFVRTNTKAKDFYATRGWVVQKEYPHERDPVTMIEMAKVLESSG